MKWLKKIKNLTSLQKLCFYGLAAVGIAAVSFMAGGILLRGFIVAAIITCSGIFTLNRLPEKARTWMLDKPIVTNLAATGLAAAFIGVTTVTGLIATAFTFLLVDIAQNSVAMLKSIESEEQPVPAT